MKKKILCLALAALMAVGAPMTAHAEEFVGSKNWNVDFDGDRMNSNFSSAEMTEEILQIQPGDGITLQVNVTNKYEHETDWYMTNEVIQTLEESVNVAEGGAYTYILTYHDSTGAETVLYSSEVVGGEEDTALEGEGLHQATNQLEDYFFLDRLANGESGYVSLYVKLDGETQGNDYQDTLARLQMNFAVEKVEAETVTKTVIETVKTGDTAPLMMFSVLALASGVILLVIAAKNMKERRSQKGE